MYIIYEDDFDMTRIREAKIKSPTSITSFSSLDFPFLLSKFVPLISKKPENFPWKLHGQNALYDLLGGKKLFEAMKFSCMLS